MRIGAVIVIYFLVAGVAAETASIPHATVSKGPGGRKAKVGEVAEHAVQQMNFTLPGSHPFHLSAQIYETQSTESDRRNEQSDYKADIEEYWINPSKWRRTIQSPDFSQTLIVNGDQVAEQNKGEYYPWWLKDLVTAIFDPLPMLDQLKQLPSEMAVPTGTEHSTTCADFHTKIDRSVFCFEGSHGALASVSSRGYIAEFRDYRDFQGKRVARKIVIDPEPGTTIKAFVTNVESLDEPDEALFKITEITPATARIRSTQISEDTLRKLLLEGSVNWPRVGGGLLKGRCAVYVSVDRTGKPREVWPKGCDNPGLEDPLREQVKKWQFQPATMDNIPVQVESLLTFEFETTLVKK